ncbi:MAG: aldo/keto reductase [Anaerolineae bacterium]
MRKVAIPNTHLTASAICLGTGGMGTTIPADEAFAMLDYFTEAGGNFLDTALIYANWIPGEKSVSEKTIGRWMKARGNRQAIIVGTKGAHPDLNAMHIPRLSAREIAADVDASLSHLQTDCIDLYWLHRDDPARPVEEIIHTLNDLATAGKIRYFGCSNWRAPRIRAANVYAAQHGLQGFVADQMMWSMAVADMDAIADKTLAGMDDALYQFHLETGMAAAPYSSQAGGLFQRLAAGGVDAVKPGARAIYPLEPNLRRLERAQTLARQRALSVSQVALGYLLSQPFPTFPIVGCRTMAQLVDSLSAAHVQLAPQDVRYLEIGAA